MLFLSFSRENEREADRLGHEIVAETGHVALVRPGNGCGTNHAFGKVVAEVEVDDYIKIPVDSRIAVASYGLIGAKVISIRPGGSDEYIEAESVVQGQYEKGLGDVVHEMGEALGDIQTVLKSADDILGGRMDSFRAFATSSMTWR